MPDNQGDEALFRADLASILKQELKDELTRQKLALEENAKVLYDLTATVGKGRFEPRLGFLEQDIIFFTRAGVEPVLGTYFRNTQETASIRVPRLIIETKYKGVSSHSLMTYSNIATRIKGIFADAKYYLLLRYDNKNAETLLRHGTGFDRIIQLERFKATRTVKHYTAGALGRDLAANKDLRDRLEKLVRIIKADLLEEKLIS